MKVLLLVALITLFGRSHSSASCTYRSNDCPSDIEEYFNQYGETNCSGFHIRDAIQAQITFMNQPGVRILSSKLY